MGESSAKQRVEEKSTAKGRLCVPCYDHNDCGCYEVDLDRLEKNVDKLHSKMSSDMTVSKGLIATAFGLSVTFSLAILTLLPGALDKSGPLDQLCCTPSSPNLVCCPSTATPAELPPCCTSVARNIAYNTSAVVSQPSLPLLLNNQTFIGCLTSSAAQQYRVKAIQILRAATACGFLLAAFLAFEVAKLRFWEQVHGLYEDYLQGATRVSGRRARACCPWWNCSTSSGGQAQGSSSSTRAPPSACWQEVRDFRWQVLRMLGSSYMWLVFGISLITGYAFSGVRYFQHSDFCKSAQIFNGVDFHLRAASFYSVNSTGILLLSTLWMYLRQAMSHEVDALTFQMKTIMGDEEDLKSLGERLRSRRCWKRGQTHFKKDPPRPTNDTVPEQRAEAPAAECSMATVTRAVSDGRVPSPGGAEIAWLPLDGS